ncbi:MAG: hypothetical protein D6736_18255 [Nitrospinota bacterium]|nr:MAG: hypothetical protein D6736_18255 [Nitrospinota bacterium]
MKRKELLYRCSAVVLTLFLGIFFLAAGAYGAGPKYVILLFADGTGLAQMELGRMANRYLYNEEFTVTDRIFREGALGLLTTQSANYLVTDSAAAGTAMATGHKTKNGMVGVTPEGMPVKSALEVAQETGRRVGIVTTDTVTDATPAAFAAHVKSRKLHPQIAEQYVAKNLDLMLGGGRAYFLPQSAEGSKRKDDKDLLAALKAKGYAYVTNLKELKEVQGTKVIGLFADKALPLELDRDRSTVPSIYEMTDAALKILSRDNSPGFFVLLETENTDTASHRNDISDLLAELRVFDRAVRLAYDFYKAHPDETLVLVAGDHDTGGPGMTYVKESLSGGKTVYPTVENLRVATRFSISLNKAKKLLGKNPSDKKIDEVMAKYFPGVTLSPQQREAIKTGKLYARNFYNLPQNAIGGAISELTQIYWASRGHTQQPVYVGAIGVGAERFRGYMDNTEFGRILIELLSEPPMAKR